MSAGPVGSQLAVDGSRKHRRGGHGGKTAAAASDAGCHDAPRLGPSGRPGPLHVFDESPLQMSTARAFAYLVVPGTCDRFNPGASLAARGITNSSNFCFMSAVLQALAHTPPFVHFCVNAAAIEKALLASQPKDPTLPKGGTTLGVLGTWLATYWKHGSGAAVPPRLPFALNASRPHTRGQQLGHLQEDAQEFLTRLIEELDADAALLRAAHRSATAGRVPEEGNPPRATTQPHAANAATVKQKKGGGERQHAGGKWITVGAKPREKLRVTIHSAATAGVTAPPTRPTLPAIDEDDDGISTEVTASSLFRGTLHQHIRGASGGAKGVTSVNVEPFLVLPLDVAAGNSVEEAFHALATKEAIEDETHNSTIRKATAIGSLPKVLILQLRRWAVTREGELVKLDNAISFGLELVVPKEVCEANKLEGAVPITLRMRKYRLVAAVCHRGASLTSGHYVTYLADPALQPPQQLPSQEQQPDASAASPPMVLCNDAKLTVSTLAKAVADCPYFLVFQRASS